MKLKLLAVALGSSIVTAAAMAAAIPPKNYQLQGKVIQFTNDVITVQKGNELIEVGRGASAKIPGDLAPGNNVTITYRMLAQEVKIEPAAAAKPAAKGAAPAKK